MAENLQTTRPAEEGWTTVIRPRTGWFDIDLNELWRYRDLITMFVKRNFTVLYKQTILGPAWIILNPLITTVIFNVVFGGMANMPTDGVPGFLFYMAGNTVWTFFANCVNNTANTFVTNSQVLARSTSPPDHAGHQPGADKPYQLWHPGGYVPDFLGYFFCHGQRHHLLRCGRWRFLSLCWKSCCWASASASSFPPLTTKYRDLAIAVGFGVQLWMYASPVVYPLSMLDNSPCGVLVQLNPHDVAD